LTFTALYIAGHISYDELVTLHDDAANAGAAKADELKNDSNALPSAVDDYVDMRWEGAKSTYPGSKSDYRKDLDLTLQYYGTDLETATIEYNGSMAYYDSLKNSFGVNNAQSWYYDPTRHAPKRIPPAGSLIFFNGLDHVAISMGTTDGNGNVEIMSLWVLPKDKDEQLVHTAQHTTIEYLLYQAKTEGMNMKVTYVQSPW